MPQFDVTPDFLHLLPLDYPIYRSVFMLVARREGQTYPAGSAFLIAPGYLQTAKHVLRHIKKEVAQIEIDENYLARFLKPTEFRRDIHGAV